MDPLGLGGPRREEDLGMIRPRPSRLAKRMTFGSAAVALLLAGWMAAGPAVAIPEAPTEAPPGAMVTKILYLGKRYPEPAPLSLLDKILKDEGVQGAFRFLKRFWTAVHSHVAQPRAAKVNPDLLDGPQKDLRRKTHQTIAKVSDDIGRRYTFNTAIAAIMELLNAVNRFDDPSPAGRSVAGEALDAIVLLLSPIVPHIAHELWQALGHRRPLVYERWPVTDPAALAKDLLEIVVQVNGRLRGRVSIAADADRAAIEQLALADENVRRFVADHAIRKVIVVPGRLVNIVV